MNLAKLPKEERDAIEVDKHVCLAKHKMRGKTRFVIKEYLKTVSPAVAKKVNELMDKKVKR
jgi:hypothetical protein